MRTRGIGESPASEAHRRTSAADPEMACLAGVRHAGLMVIEVTRIGGVWTRFRAGGGAARGGVPGPLGGAAAKGRPGRAAPAPPPPARGALAKYPPGGPPPTAA